MNDAFEGRRARFVLDLAHSKEPVFVILRVLNRHNPIGIVWEVNPDEYAAEARMILERMPSAHGPQQVAQIVHEVFVQAFGRKGAGPEESYAELGRELWQAWIEDGPARGHQRMDRQR